MAKASRAFTGSPVWGGRHRPNKSLQPTALSSRLLRYPLRLERVFSSFIRRFSCAAGCGFSLQLDLFLPSSGWGFCGDEEDGANQIEMEMRDHLTLIKGGENRLLPFLIAQPRLLHYIESKCVELQYLSGREYPNF